MGSRVESRSLIFHEQHTGCSLEPLGVHPLTRGHDKSPSNSSQVETCEYSAPRKELVGARQQESHKRLVPLRDVGLAGSQPPFG